MKCQSNFFLCSTRHCWGSPDWCHWPHEHCTAVFPQANATQQLLRDPLLPSGACQQHISPTLQPPWCGVLHQSPWTYSWTSQTRYSGLGATSFPRQAQALCSEQFTALSSWNLPWKETVQSVQAVWSESLWEPVWVTNKVISQSHRR